MTLLARLFPQPRTEPQPTPEPVDLQANVAAFDAMGRTR